MEESGVLQKELEEANRLAAERLNQLRYLQADFENYRRVCAKEKETITELANERLIDDLLVILDDFGHALPCLTQENNREGMEMIYKKLVQVLSRYGLEPIDCVGKKFDPRCHEAICTERRGEPGTVLEDLGRGYRLKSKVIRPSKVKIAEHVAEPRGE